MCRRFASPQMYPISATQATTNRNIPYTHSACPQRGHLPISGSVGATNEILSAGFPSAPAECDCCGTFLTHGRNLTANSGP
jgi:hypothetical protein